MASPLILGNDPRKMSKRALAMLTAKEVVAVGLARLIWTAYIFFLYIISLCLTSLVYTFYSYPGHRFSFVRPAPRGMKRRQRALLMFVNNCIYTVLPIYRGRIALCRVSDDVTRR